MSNDYEQYWRDRARQVEPRFKNYGIMCEVHHGEYGGLASKLVLARMFTKQRQLEGACEHEGCQEPRCLQRVEGGPWLCEKHGVAEAIEHHRQSA